MNNYFYTEEYKTRTELMFYDRQLMSLARMGKKWNMKPEVIRRILQKRASNVSALYWRDETGRLNEILSTMRPGIHAMILASMVKEVLDN